MRELRARLVLAHDSKAVAPRDLESAQHACGLLDKDHPRVRIVAKFGGHGMHPRAPTQQQAEVAVARDGCN